MKHYSTPEISVLTLSSEDVLTFSILKDFGVIMDWDNDGTPDDEQIIDA